jgi:hypothetical protein
LVAEHAAHNEGYMSGKLLRSRIGSTNHATLDSLVPYFLDRIGTRPSDQYKPTLNCLLQSQRSDAFRHALATLLRVLTSKFHADADIKTYASQDLGIADHASYFVYQAVIGCARLGNGGQSQAPTSFSYGVPPDIEELVDLNGDVDAFVAHFRAAESDRLASAQVVRRVPPVDPTAGKSYDVFLSHSAHDRDEAKGVYDRLRRGGYHVFLAPMDISPGDDFAEKIRLALLISRELWLLVSKSSSKSEWVTSEWGAAWALGKRIVPILHRCAPEDLPQRLARLQCVDLHRVDEAIEDLAARLPGDHRPTRTSEDSSTS